MGKIEGVNVLGGPLGSCCQAPVTGFWRDGSCHTGPEDVGMHTVCALITEDFLEYSRAAGNDLSTPRPEFGFPGLKPGDKWCVCAARWLEAAEAGRAPRVVLESTHQRTLQVVSLDLLRQHARDLN
jgi:uncharacterized protein (DUF2237 family)